MELENIDILPKGPNAVVVRPTTRIGAEQQEEWIQALESVALGEANRVLIDMGSVDFISSRAIGILLAARTEIQRRRGRLGLMNVRPHVKKVFSISRIYELFEKVADPDPFLS